MPAGTPLAKKARISGATPSGGPAGTATTAAATSTNTSTSAANVTAAATTTDDTSLLHRLSLGSTLAGGARGTLTRCAVKLGQLIGEQRAAAAAAADKNKEAADDAAAAAAATVNSVSVTEMVHELQIAQLEMTKIYLMILERNSSEEKMEQRQQQYRLREAGLLIHDDDDGAVDKNGDDDFRLDEDVDVLISNERRVVQQLRQDLQKASWTQSCLQEYEGLAKLAASRHPTPRRVLLKRNQAVEKELQNTNQKLQTLEMHLKIRQSQFQLLIQSMLDLKQSLNEPLLEQPESGGGNKSLHPKKQQHGEDSKMQVDTPEKKGKSGKDDNDDDNNDEVLYGDL